ncbi:hypothetical protein KCU81_g4299, partial [Aureobasidium melanogenum]
MDIDVMIIGHFHETAHWGRVPRHLGDGDIIRLNRWSWFVKPCYTTGAIKRAKREDATNDWDPNADWGM